MHVIHIYSSLIHTFINSWQMTFQKDFWSHGLWGLLSWSSSCGTFWWLFSGARSVGKLSSVNWLQFILVLANCGPAYPSPPECLIAFWEGHSFSITSSRSDTFLFSLLRELHLYLSFIILTSYLALQWFM